MINLHLILRIKSLKIPQYLTKVHTSLSLLRIRTITRQSQDILNTINKAINKEM